jgi:hypothetical protein
MPAVTNFPNGAAHSDHGDPLARVHGDPPFWDGDQGFGVRATHWVELVISVLSRSVKRDVAHPRSQ